MKTKYIFRTLILLLTICFFSIFINYCSDPASTTPDPSLNSISGSIVNWDQGSNVQLKSVITVNSIDIILDSSIVDPSGNFSIKLPAPPDSVLSLVKYLSTTYCTANVNANPVETKGAALKLYLYKFTLIGEIIQGDSVHSPYQLGDYIIMYEYYDRNTSITGQTVCNFITYNTYNYNISGKKGWNKIRYLYQEQTPTFNTYIYDNTIPKNPMWTYWLTSSFKTNK
jgi:hypothetical protein